MNDTAEWFRGITTGERRGVRAVLWRAGMWWARIPYGGAVWLRNRFYDRGWRKSNRAGVPVVSVGNLTLGGTGKTPCVEWVARYFLEQGLIAPVLSRGYGATGGPNDEAMVLEENVGVPHLQGADRLALALTAIEELEADVLILDDGFQHRRLARNLDIVLVDATDPAGYMFPRGTLREGRGELRRAGVIVLTRCDQVSPDRLDSVRAMVRRHNRDAPVVSTVHRPVELVGHPGGIEMLNGQPIAAFCGIGNPASFRRTLEDLGAKVIAFRTFADHHAYSREDVADLQRWAAELPPDAWVLTTQKDMVKLRVAELGGRPLWALRVGMAFLDGQDAFEGRLNEVISD